MFWVFLIILLSIAAVWALHAGRSIRDFNDGWQAYNEGRPMNVRWPEAARNGYMSGWNHDNMAQHKR